MSGYLLEMKGIAKRFDGVPALDGIDLAIRPGECIGLCGENGAGKSTLMKVLSAVYPHGTWDGEILLDGQPLRAQSIRDTEDAGIIIIHQELMLVPELSVAENIFLGKEPTQPGGRLDYPAMNRRADDILRELKLPDVNVVLHCHSIYATTLACHHKPIPSFHYMVGLAGGTDIRCARYATFGTQGLSDAAIEAADLTRRMLPALPANRELQSHIRAHGLPRT